MWVILSENETLVCFRSIYLQGQVYIQCQWAFPIIIIIHIKGRPRAKDQAEGLRLKTDVYL